jgi:hypothetical protein
VNGLLSFSLLTVLNFVGIVSLLRQDWVLVCITGLLCLLFILNPPGVED